MEGIASGLSRSFVERLRVEGCRWYRSFVEHLGVEERPALSSNILEWEDCRCSHSFVEHLRVEACQWSRSVVEHLRVVVTHLRIEACERYHSRRTSRGKRDYRWSRSFVERLRVEGPAPSRSIVEHRHGELEKLPVVPLFRRTSQWKVDGVSSNISEWERLPVVPFFC